MVKSVNICPHCPQVDDKFYSIGKTYYRIDEETVLCYRHWHQQNRPKFVDKGDCDDILTKASIQKGVISKIKKNEQSKTEKRIRFSI